MIVPKCNGNTGTDFSNCDKQQEPMAAKKTVLRDLQNGNRTVVSKSLTTPPFVKDPVPDVTKVSGMKRQTPEAEGPGSPVCHQSPNSGNWHFVYIRRKSDQEVDKNNNCNNFDKNISSPPLRHIIHGEQETTTWQQTQVQGQKVSCFPAFASMPMSSLMTSSGGPSIPHSLGKPVNVLATTGINPTEVLPTNPHTFNDQNWKERFPHLQTFLRNCDHSSQDEYIQVLKSLSSVGRSRHAVELEKRAIHLLLEEGKELHRMKILNVFGKTSSSNLVSPTTSQVHTGK